MSTPPDNARAKPPENLLYRSNIEICRILDALAKDGISISTEFSSGRIFVSHILSVNPRTGHFVISYCANKLLNSMLFELTSINFKASQHDKYIEFEVCNPTDTQLDGQPAIQFSLPNSLTLGNRRELSRIPVPADAMLRCIADEDGFVPFESYITDISHDAFGGMIIDSEINLQPGTVLKRCRIIVPNGNAVVADLEIRNVKATTLADGTSANRIGLRFIQRPDEIAELIDFFIRDVDKK